jgi:hypothetical protein
MQDAYKLQGQYTTDLLSFVTACVNRMELDDIHYSKVGNVSEKMNKFKKLQTALKDKTIGMDEAEQQVLEVAKMHRGLSIGNSDTYKAFKQYKKEMQKARSESKNNDSSPSKEEESIQEQRLNE